MLPKSARDTFGLKYWPDGTMGILPSAGCFVFLAANGGTLARTVGSIDNPTNGGVRASIGIRDLKHAYQYAAGGSAYRDPATGTLLLVYHAEQWPNGDPTKFYSLLGMAKSTDAGMSWTDLGEIVRPEVPFGSVPVEVGGGPLVVVGDQFYVYFQDVSLSARSNFAVARAPVDAVVRTAVERNDVVPWSKFRSGSWSEPALGGRSSGLESGNPGSRWFDVVLDPYLGRYLVVGATGGGPVNLYLAQSPDGISWSSRQALTTDVGESFYPTIVGVGDDPRRPTDRFYVYFTYSIAGGFDRWTDAVLARRLITIRKAP